MARARSISFNRNGIGRRGVLGLFPLTLFPARFLGCQREEPATGEPERELVVFAATSLKDAFTELGVDFRRAHPGVDLRLNFAGTQELHTQLEHGAPADIFASADQRHMKELSQAGRVLEPQIFARNEPVLAVSSEKRAQIRQFSDLPFAGRIILGVPEVPIGRYSLAILDRANATLGSDFRARVEAKIISRELNVRQVLAKISLGEADAGIVYRSDAHAAGERVAVLPIPSELNVIAEYPIALVRGARHPNLAREWLAAVSSENGRAKLRAAGFLAPIAAAP
jgi:molybdate transport system substrate-binding protein